MWKGGLRKGRKVYIKKGSLCIVVYSFLIISEIPWREIFQLGACRNEHRHSSFFLGGWAITESWCTPPCLCAFSQPAARLSSSACLPACLAAHLPRRPKNWDVYSHLHYSKLSVEAWRRTPSALLQCTHILHIIAYSTKVWGWHL